MILGSVLHILSGSYNSLNPDHGSKKDIENRINYFVSKYFSYTKIFVNKRSDLELLRYLSKCNLSGVDYIIYEHSRYPKTLAYLKKHTKIIQIVRAHNAEFYHSIQTAIAVYQLESTSLTWRLKLIKRYLLAALSKLYHDIKIGFYADYILTINQCEHSMYWNLIARKRKLQYLPYLTSVYQVNSHSIKNIDLLILGSATFNPLAWNNVYKIFKYYSEEIKKGKVKIFIVGDYKYKPLLKFVNKFKSFVYLGLVEDLQTIIANTKVLLHPSSLGMGFKTKIHDVIINGGIVAIPKKLLYKIPSEYQNRTFFLEDYSSINDLVELYDSLPPYSDNINSQLSLKFNAVLDNIFVNSKFSSSSVIKEVFI